MYIDPLFREIDLFDLSRDEFNDVVKAVVQDKEENDFWVFLVVYNLAMLLSKVSNLPPDENIYDEQLDKIFSTGTNVVQLRVETVKKVKLEDKVQLHTPFYATDTVGAHLGFYLRKSPRTENSDRSIDLH